MGQLYPGFARVIADKVCLLVCSCSVFFFWNFWWGFVVWFGGIILFNFFFISLFISVLWFWLFWGLFFSLFFFLLLFVSLSVLHFCNVVVLFCAKYFSPESHMLSH